MFGAPVIDTFLHLVRLNLRITTLERRTPEPTPVEGRLQVLTPPARFACLTNHSHLLESIKHLWEYRGRGPWV